MELQGFIAKNNFKLRSEWELVAKSKEVQANSDFFNFRQEVLIDYLPFESAKSYLKDEYVKEVESGVKEWQQITQIEQCAADFVDYMKFAWGKAEDERGISAARSIQKLGMWLWIMQRDDLQEIIENENLYNPYGAPALIEVCDLIGLEVPASLIEFAKTKC